MIIDDAAPDEDAVPVDRSSCPRCGADTGGEPAAAARGSRLHHEPDAEPVRRYPDWAYRPPYTHLATVRGHVGVPVRRSGPYWVCAVQIDFGYYWGAADVRDVEPLPHR